MRPLAAAALLLSILAFAACTDPAPKQATPKTAAKKTPVTPAAPPAPLITYHAYSLKDTGYKAFKKLFSKEQQTIILGLNRVDAGNVRRVDTVVVPDTFLQDWMAYSPFPRELPQAAEVKKLVLFSYPVQAFAAYENGTLVHWGPTNMGKKATPTPTGLFFANWKALETHSTVNDEWLLKWNFNVSNKGGVGWHLYALPGYPASHSCMRLLEADARWLYDWAEMWIVDRAADVVIASGTPTIVFGSYPWGQPRPWKALLNKGDANNVPADTLKALLDGHLPKILAKQTQRDSVVAARGSSATTMDTTATAN